MTGDDKDRCFLCGKYGRMDVHHCLHGSYRRKADQYGLMVHLCRSCHMRLHDRGDHDKDLQRMAQEEFEKVYGHEKWMQEFGRNFL